MTGIKNISKVTRQKMHFNGSPSVWQFPGTVNVIRSILGKPKIFETVYYALLKSGLLYDFWRRNFVTELGCLEAIEDNDIKKCKTVLQNFFAATPEETTNKLSPEFYIQRLIALRIGVKKLNDSDLLKNAGKMAGYILKNEPEFCVFGTHLETRKFRNS